AVSALHQRSIGTAAVRAVKLVDGLYRPGRGHSEHDPTSGGPSVVRGSVEVTIGGLNQRSRNRRRNQIADDAELARRSDLVSNYCGDPVIVAVFTLNGWGPGGAPVGRNSIKLMQNCQCSRGRGFEDCA